MNNLTLEQRQDVYQRAVAKWGQCSQMEMANEEATEFALAIRKQLRKMTPESFANLVDEFADLEIMMEQVELMHRDLNFREYVDQRKEFKIKRLIDRLDKDSFEALETESTHE